jgi:hypothetical protein
VAWSISHCRDSYCKQDHRANFIIQNDIPILPLANAYVPPLLYAPQAAIPLYEFELSTFDFHNAPSFALDYYREGPVPEHPSATSNIYNPKLTLDILGAGIEGYNTLLVDDNMRMISLYLKELPPFSKFPFTPISERSFRIFDVRIEDRFPSHYPLTTPDELKDCTLWSWRCSEFGMEYPWYKFVYRQAFDEYGKIGSFRHMVLQRWGTMFKRFGLWRSVTMLVVLIVLTGMIFTSVVLGCYSLWKNARAYYQRQLDQYDWRMDEEAERLLYGIEDGIEEGIITRDVIDDEKNEIAGEEQTGIGKEEVEKPLPPILDKSLDMPGSS